MHDKILAWRAHRLLVDSLSRPMPFLSGGRRLLFLSVRDPLCHTQLFPFFYYRRTLARRWGISIAELPLARFLEKPPRPDPRIDAVAFQTWFDLSEEEMQELVTRIRETYPQARLAYLDWFGPTDLRYAAALDPHIHVYLKKQVLRDRGQYGHPTQGDTNLTDYYGRRFSLAQPEVCHTIPHAFFDKVLLGSNFCFSPYMLAKFSGVFPDGERPIDLHARFETKGAEWYSRMRQEARKSMDRLTGLKIVSHGLVSRDVYFRELYQSKICFSPFGYGEVCWRDYEAAFSGALLVKPDMSHLVSRPDIFRAYETYVPVRWDLTDFEETVQYYLADSAERTRIARNAFETVSAYIRDNTFLEESSPFFSALLVEEGAHA